MTSVFVEEDPYRNNQVAGFNAPANAIVAAADGHLADADSDEHIFSQTVQLNKSVTQYSMLTDVNQ